MHLFQSWRSIRFILPAWLAGLVFLSACSAGGATIISTPSADTQPPGTVKPTYVLPTLPAVLPAACTVVSAAPTAAATAESLFAPVTSQDHQRGKDSAVVTILQYCDFQSAQCGYLAPVLATLSEEIGDDLRVVYRYFPLPGSDKGLLASQAAEAAARQGKFWEMHDRLFGNQSVWVNFAEEGFVSWLQTQAGELRLNVEQFTSDLKSAQVIGVVKAAQDNGLAIGLPGVPFLVINGKMYQGSRDINNLRQVVQLLRLQERQFTQCPPFTLDTKKQYTARLVTSRGDVVLSLFADQAPMAVNSFIYLAQNGWFDNTSFFNVEQNYRVFAGDPSGTGMGNPGYLFGDEITSGLRFDRAGVVALVSNGPDTNGSQFFITLAATPDLNNRNTIFGQVLRGMEILQGLQASTAEQLVIERVEITSQ